MGASKFYPLSIILLFIILVGAYYIYPSQTEMQIEPVNYKALVQSGMAPTTPSRAVTQEDIDTGLRINYNGEVLALIESRNWNTLDYGKTFLVKVA